MKYSNFHKNKNPFSPARLDEAFKASKMEGGPGDPVKVKVDKDEKAGTVTVTKSSKGKQKELSPEEKKVANTRWANMTFCELSKSMSEAEKQAARDRKAQREAISSFTYKKLDYHDSMPMELMDEDIDIEMAPIPDDYLEKPVKETSTPYTYTTSETKPKKSKDKSKDPKIKDDGLSECDPNNNTECVAPIGDQSKKALRGAKKKRKIEERASRKRDRQIERGTFDPKGWFEEKTANMSRNKAIRQRKRDQKKRGKNTPIKDFFSDLSFNKPKEKPTSRTISAKF